MKIDVWLLTDYLQYIDEFLQQLSEKFVHCL